MTTHEDELQSILSRSYAPGPTAGKVEKYLATIPVASRRKMVVSLQDVDAHGHSLMADVLTTACDTDITFSEKSVRSFRKKFGIRLMQKPVAVLDENGEVEEINFSDDTKVPSLAEIGLSPKEYELVPDDAKVGYRPTTGNISVSGFKVRRKVNPASVIVSPKVNIEMMVSEPRQRTLPEGWKTLMYIPDEQLDFHVLPSKSGNVMDLTTDDLLSTHDEEAMNLVITMAEHIRPDNITHAGDVMDLSILGRWGETPGAGGIYGELTNMALRYTKGYMLMLDKLCDEHHWMEGNHEARIVKAMMEYMRNLLGVTRGGEIGGLPILSLENMVALDETNVQYHGGYPGNEYWVTDTLLCVHGPKTGRSVAQKYVNDNIANVLFGHSHTADLAFNTRKTRGSSITNWAASPGALCKADLSVPGYYSGQMADGSRIDGHPYDWQPGFCLVTYHPDIPYSESVQTISIEHKPDGTPYCIFEGVMFEAEEYLNVKMFA